VLEETLLRKMEQDPPSRNGLPHSISQWLILNLACGLCPLAPVTDSFFLLFHGLALRQTWQSKSDLTSFFYAPLANHLCAYSCFLAPVSGPLIRRRSLDLLQPIREDTALPPHSSLNPLVFHTRSKIWKGLLSIYLLDKSCHPTNT
jgi:hypothetical protein